MRFASSAAGAGASDAGGGGADPPARRLRLPAAGSSSAARPLGLCVEALTAESSSRKSTPITSAAWDRRARRTGIPVWSSAGMARAAGPRRSAVRCRCSRATAGAFASATSRIRALRGAARRPRAVPVRLRAHGRRLGVLTERLRHAPHRRQPAWRGRPPARVQPRRRHAGTRPYPPPLRAAGRGPLGHLATHRRPGCSSAWTTVVCRTWSRDTLSERTTPGARPQALLAVSPHLGPRSRFCARRELAAGFLPLATTAPQYHSRSPRLP